jgi:N-acetylneuraminic acid mutarotase
MIPFVPNIRRFSVVVAAARACLTVAATLLVSALGRAQADTWVAKAPMPTARYQAAAGTAGGMIYVAGGCVGGVIGSALATLEAYDPEANAWGRRSPMPTARCGLAAGVVGGKIYFIGGIRPVGLSGWQALATVEAYDPKTDTWTEEPPMLTARSLLGAAVVGGLLYAVGGEGRSGAPLATVEAYNPATGVWTAEPSMPAPRYACVAASVGGILYVGAGGADTLTHDVDAFDPRTNVWRPLPMLPTARYAPGAGVVAGSLYVVGGAGTAAVEAFNLEGSTWTIQTPLPFARSGIAVGVAEDVLYAIGGENRGDAFATNEAFSPFEMVKIDIKPGDPSNVINLKSGGVVPVAILGSATFDPMTVEPSTVTFAGAHVATRGRGVPMTSVSDVNHDGYPDLVLDFSTQDLQLTSSSTEAVLYGTTYSGTPIRGSDSVRIVPPPKTTTAASGRLLPRRILPR